ncbi:hypothetical protein FDG2_2801 [Candidatus Protofrankia californiensis]|uniref:Uncharacterized protein n=1 Tax=Candidatus Protofrankia californiensis TaxID=1839754 RepID=A0A1C3NYE1_9ACTN|nr:hypothetical protein FDG2_2801 [Candidatus Protofrankia californiensis]
MVAVGVDQGGPVLRGLLQPLGLGDSGIALDGVQRQLQAAGAFQQANPLEISSRSVNVSSWPRTQSSDQ